MIGAVTERGADGASESAEQSGMRSDGRAGLKLKISSDRKAVTETRIFAQDTKNPHTYE
jgi:hypothetical protein